MVCALPSSVESFTTLCAYTMALQCYCRVKAGMGTLICRPDVIVGKTSIHCLHVCFLNCTSVTFFFLLHIQLGISIISIINLSVTKFDLFWSLPFFVVDVFSIRIWFWKSAVTSVVFQQWCNKTEKTHSVFKHILTLYQQKESKSNVKYFFDDMTLPR